jgi:hypothetical protein
MISQKKKDYSCCSFMIYNTHVTLTSTLFDNIFNFLFLTHQQSRLLLVRIPVYYFLQYNTLQKLNSHSLELTSYLGSWQFFKKFNFSKKFPNSNLFSPKQRYHGNILFLFFFLLNNGWGAVNNGGLKSGNYRSLISKFSDRDLNFFIKAAINNCSVSSNVFCQKNIYFFQYNFQWINWSHFSFFFLNSQFYNLTLITFSRVIHKAAVDFLNW